MKLHYLILLLTLVLFSTSFGFAQDGKNNTAALVSPTATPPPSDDADVVKISTTLIQVDATVTDKKGIIVKDLKPEDFEIYENGKLQNITNFSFVETKSDQPSKQTAPAAPKKSDKSIPLPPAKLAPEQVRRTYAFVVDDLGLSFAGIGYVKDTLKRFVNEQMQDGDLVAILRVGSGLGALQSFTSDKRLLLSAVNKIRWNGMSRTGVFSYEPFSQTLIDNKGADPRDPVTTGQNAQDKEANLRLTTERQSNSAFGTLGALNYIVRGMSNLPGRKSVMLFSEGFQLIDYSSNGSLAIPKSIRIVDSLRALTDVANRAAVVFYTFDPRGIIAPGVEAGDDVGVEGPSRIGRFNAGEIRGNQIRDSKDSLRILANETGGLAYVDLNRMDLGLQKAINDQNGYYLIGYQPDDETFEARKIKFNKLEVKIKNSDLKIRYRSGFFGITDENLKQKQTTVQKFNAALLSPFGATEVNLDLYSMFYNDEKNQNYIRSFIRINANDLKFTHDKNGKYKAVVDVAAMTFGDNGTPIDQVVKGYTVELDETGYQKSLRDGIVYNFLLPIKKAGPYQFRIALRDEATNKVGSASQFIEVPNIKNKKLALSSILLRNYSLTDWKKHLAGQDSELLQNGNIFIDTAARQFKRGTVVNYLYEIYNAELNESKKPQLQVQFKLFRDGKIISQGDQRELKVKTPANPQRIEISNAIALGTNLESGQYVLQLIISDALEKDQIVAQSVDFEITD